MQKIIHSTPMFVFTYYFGHILYYFCIFLLCSRSVYTWYQLKYTKFRNGGLVGGFAISSDGYFFFCFFTFIPVPLSPLSLSFIILLSLVSFSLGDNTKWPTRVDVLLNPNTIKSRLRLSWITAYLEVKIWSLFKHESLITGNKILWKKRRNFLLFSTIFSIYL